MDNREIIFKRLKNSEKTKGIKFNERLLKKYYSCMPVPITKVSNISLMGNKKYPYFKLSYHWSEGDSCLFSFNAKKFCSKVLIGYLDGYGVYSLRKIDLNNIGRFLVDSKFRIDFIKNSVSLDLDNFEWLDE